MSKALDQKGISYSDNDSSQINRLYKNNFTSTDRMDISAQVIEQHRSTLSQNTLASEVQQTLRNGLSSIIDQNGFMNSQQKTQAKLLVGNVIFMTDRTTLAGLNAKEQEFVNAIKIVACGVGSVIPNALAFALGDRQIIILCSELLNRSITKEDGSISVAQKLSFIVGHEIGHFLYLQAEDSYDEYTDCLRDHPSHSELKKEKTHNPFRLIFSDLQVNPHMAEIASDHWGHSLAGLTGSSLPWEQRTEFFFRTYRLFCSIKNSDDGEHPAVDYRLKRLAAWNTQFAETFHCLATSNDCRP